MLKYRGQQRSPLGRRVRDDERDLIAPFTWPWTEEKIDNEYVNG
jgi:hypothetical protein